MKLPLIQPRSQLVLEAGLFAHCRGKGAAFNHAVFQAFFEYGKDIGDLAILRELAEQVGLNAQELSHSLTTGVFSDQRVRDEDLARELAIVSVPTMVISLPSEPLHEGTILVGAQPYEVLNEIVERKLKQRSMDARLSA
jgi:predicted DsbA family dithiol-disulfide isomerase